MTDSHKKTCIKSISWRVISTSITLIIIYIITGNIQASWIIAVVDGIFKFISFYIFERICTNWDNMKCNTLSKTMPV